MVKIKNCVGCGYCCITSQCVASVRLYGNIKYCPQLIWNEEKSRYYCGLMQLPEPLGSDYRKELYAGKGCCSPLNTWRKDIKRRVPMLSLSNPLPPLLQIFLKCVTSQFISRDVFHLIVMQFINELEKRKYDKEEIKIIKKYLEESLFNNRREFVEGFMG